MVSFRPKTDFILHQVFPGELGVSCPLLDLFAVPADMLLLNAVVTLVALYAFRLVYRFLRNFYNARKIGLPFILFPFDTNSVLWAVVGVPLRPVLQRLLPSALWDRLTITIHGWQIAEPLRPFELFAAPQGNPKSLSIVGCGKDIAIWTHDPEIITEILRRTREFEQPDVYELFMGTFGHNVFIDNGDPWSRQRKVVSSVINERVSKAVFNETVQQTRGMVDEIMSHSTEAQPTSAVSREMFDMLKKITIHVLMGAGMGDSVPWKNDDEEIPPGFKMTYMGATQTVMDSVIGPIFLPVALLCRWPSWLPGYGMMSKLGLAKQEFIRHTDRLLDEERRRIGEKSTRNNIMSQMLRASEQDSTSGKALSDDEMKGNLFVFTVAGFETTANTLSYALMYLVRYPLWQDWLLEEIDQIVPDDEQSFEYISVHPRAVRIMAFMLETSRLHPIIANVARENPKPQVITTSRGTVYLPARTTVRVNPAALNLEPSVWRDINHDQDPNFARGSALPGVPDEYVFRPSRWLTPPGSQQPLFQPPRGAFIPWSMGPRVCPGQKMAQVEFTAAILTLLHKHRVEAVPIGSESREQVEQRLNKQMCNSSYTMTLHMDGTEGSEGGVPIRLSRRG